ncbi:hypothetical protein [Nitrosopumilus sp.]|uniref:hypothetical protein n=1 Tax=Nitrosopumilus sp. TaxID=2024843 RepID=UPI00247E74B6|nr:hypothetical protein [Nitrosopumilus sp.]MCV0409637.1 hypothetical protein [Nitrosopumilus sp.]
MKTRLMIIGIVSIAGFLTIPFYATNVYCDVFDSENGTCMRISGIGPMDYSSLPYFVIDSKNTGNSNECWVLEDDGSLTPCKMDGRPSVMMFFVVFWPYIISGIAIMIVFTVWRIRK